MCVPIVRENLVSNIVLYEPEGPGQNVYIACRSSASLLTFQMLCSLYKQLHVCETINPLD